uniref:Uncharacterized protein n=1 Tax=Arundo donax TaxID=35708 RepID=A0A0A9C906_ARUDO
MVEIAGLQRHLVDGTSSEPLGTVVFFSKPWGLCATGLEGAER